MSGNEHAREKSYEISFQIIAAAGDAQSKARDAISAANEYRFEDARNLLREAKEDIKVCHDVQTSIIQSEAAGESCDVNIILVHSQDHLSMALILMDFAEQAIRLNQKIQRLEQGA